jgi:hypothetical protein
MSDIALIGERTFLYEKLFEDLGVSFQFLSSAVLGSPFLPRFKAVIIPTGFANPEYSKTLPALQRMKSNISNFVKSANYPPEALLPTGTSAPACFAPARRNVTATWSLARALRLS